MKDESKGFPNDSCRLREVELPVGDLPEFYWREVARRRILEDRKVAGSVLLAFVSPPSHDNLNGIRFIDIFLARAFQIYSLLFPHTRFS